MSEARTVHVALGERAYDVQIGTGLLATAGERCRPLMSRGRCAVVTDETVAALHGEALRAGLAAGGVEASFVTVPPGEATKSWPHLQHVVGALLDAQVERGDAIVAFGGGVIGDLAGFAAAVLRRGVRFVQVPTTLLAQVDSSVGGKTGINAPQGKNLIGAFHQPSLVLADVDVLGTLEPRELLAGYGEVAKYGLLGDLGFFEWLEANGPAIRDGDVALRVEAVARSVAAKARIVERDEREAGDRALLNLGHTFGHALERVTGYSDRLLHGEGVSIGMGLAFELSARLGHCSQEEPVRVRAHLRRMGMRCTVQDIPGELPRVPDLLDAMRQDKKVQDGRLAFILARGIGEAFVTRDVPEAAVEALLSDAAAGRLA